MVPYRYFCYAIISNWNMCVFHFVNQLEHVCVPKCAFFPGPVERMVVHRSIIIPYIMYVYHIYIWSGKMVKKADFASRWVIFEINEPQIT